MRNLVLMVAALLISTNSVAASFALGNRVDIKKDGDDIPDITINVKNTQDYEPYDYYDHGVAYYNDFGFCENLANARAIFKDGELVIDEAVCIALNPVEEVQQFAAAFGISQSSARAEVKYYDQHIINLPDSKRKLRTRRLAERIYRKAMRVLRLNAERETLLAENPSSKKAKRILKRIQRIAGTSDRTYSFKNFEYPNKIERKVNSDIFILS